jgi:hypothetical protein
MKRAFFGVGDPAQTSLKRKLTVWLSSLILVCLIAYADRLVSREISFGVFYFLPIWLVTWSFGRKRGLIAAFICAIVWFETEKSSAPAYLNPFIHLWNAAVRFVYFSTFALLLGYVREQLQKSTTDLKRLSGLLPICAKCKKVRNDEGYWQLLEEYIRSHSDADFTHGLCPDCAQALYPELARAWLEDGEQSKR